MRIEELFEDGAGTVWAGAVGGIYRNSAPGAAAANRALTYIGVSGDRHQFLETGGFVSGGFASAGFVSGVASPNVIVDSASNFL